MLFAVGTLIGACDLSQTNFTTPPGAIGQKVRDGTFDFTVTQVNSSRTFRGRRAQGVYVIVSLAVKNVGVEPAQFYWSAQHLEDNIKRRYSAIAMDPSLFGNVVNAIDPGVEIPLKVAFDVPPGTQPTQIVLRESASSEGVPVNLTQPPAPSPRHG
jgi:hypothetical protein